MNNYEGEWNWGRIAFVLIILIALAFSVYYLFFQPREVEPVNNNKCDPFPAKLGGFVCERVEDSTTNARDLYPGIERAYIGYYNVSHDKTHALISFLFTFETRDDGEKWFERNINWCNVSNITHITCSEFYLDNCRAFSVFMNWENKSILGVAGITILDENRLIALTILDTGKLYGGDREAPKLLILELKEYFKNYEQR